VMNAIMAIASGTANYVVCYRSLAQGQFGRFGQGRAGAGMRLPGAMGFNLPYGAFTPAHQYALQARRHMHLYGTQSKHFSMISMACYKHASRNPAAVMYSHGPLSLEEAENARMISDPLRLFHCCLENDGSAAVILCSAERARDLKHRPVYIMSASQGSGLRQMAGAYNKADFDTSNFPKVAVDLWKRAGITPKDIDVAQVYENMTPMTLMSIEDHGFCKKGEGGAFVEGGRIEWPDGALPINTSGGNIAECYMHGFELVIEAVRQMRGTSTCQVKDAETCLVASGPGVSPVTDMIVRR
ncbi:MAG: acetyl-CoA acetyltransferase, partial [Chloroflexi bacterium]|nr:acetyl-CoA acetyltransferase [Chloroflexota bacterium]